MPKDFLAGTNMKIDGRKKTDKERAVMHIQRRQMIAGRRRTQQSETPHGDIFINNLISISETEDESID